MTEPNPSAKIVSPLAVLALLICSQNVLFSQSPEHWPQFRGPDARGIAEGTNLPDRWSAIENVAWKTDVPGRAWSSPIVWEERIFLTTVVSSDELESPKKGLYFGGNRPDPREVELEYRVICLDLSSGNKLWEQIAHRGTPTDPIHLKNSFASETPVTDGERVYAYFGNQGLYCLDFDGNPVWSKRFEPHATRNGWGTAASPMLHGTRLYILNDNDEQSYLLCLDKRTGKEVWRVARDEGSNWSTPFVWQNDLRTEIVTLGVRQMRSYLPRNLNGLIMMSYFVSVLDRLRRALICFISAFVTGSSWAYESSMWWTLGCRPFHVILKAHARTTFQHVSSTPFHFRCSDDQQRSIGLYLL